MTAKVINILDAAIKRDAQRDAKSRRIAAAQMELAAWTERYKDLGAHFVAQQGMALLMLSDILRSDR